MELLFLNKQNVYQMVISTRERNKAEKKDGKFCR